MKGLAPHTLQVFEAVSKLDCIKSYLLVGGTALSLQMGTRQSEDLDFMKWRMSFGVSVHSVLPVPLFHT